MPELYETPWGAVAGAGESRRFETDRVKSAGPDEPWNRARREMDISFLKLKTAWGYAKLERKLETFKQAFYDYYADVFGEPYVPRSYVPKAFDPNQPRVPAGNPDGGQWTRTGGRAGTESDSNTTSRSRFGGHDTADRPYDDPGLVILASVSPDSDDEPPKIPKKRPSTSQARTRYYKEIGIWLLRQTVSKRGAALLTILDQAGWLEPAVDNIRSFTDPPKSLEELQDDVLARPSRPGYDVHHIVPKKMADDDGFPKAIWDDPHNLARIPRIKHWAINAWFHLPNPKYRGQSPREYLRDKPWEDRRKVGLEILKELGILIDE